MPAGKLRAGSRPPCSLGSQRPLRGGPAGRVGGTGRADKTRCSHDSTRHLVSRPAWREVTSPAPEGSRTVGLRAAARPRARPCQRGGVLGWQSRQGRGEGGWPEGGGYSPGDSDTLGLGGGPAGDEVRRAKGQVKSHQTGRSLARWHLTKGGQAHGRQVWRTVGQPHPPDQAGGWAGVSVAAPHHPAAASPGLAITGGAIEHL